MALLGAALCNSCRLVQVGSDGDKRARRRTFRRHPLKGSEDEVVGALSMAISRREAVRGHIGPAADERSDGQTGWRDSRGGREGTDDETKVHRPLTTFCRRFPEHDDGRGVFLSSVPRMWWGFWGILALSPDSPSSQTSPSSFLSLPSQLPFSTPAPTI